jgi:hypothetical protein
LDITKRTSKRLQKINNKESLAKLRFIADQAGFGVFWGSNKDERDKIDNIVKKFEPFIFHEPPQELVDELLPSANELLKDGDFGWEMYIS